MGKGMGVVREVFRERESREGLEVSRLNVERGRDKVEWAPDEEEKAVGDGDGEAEAFVSLQG